MCCQPLGTLPSDTRLHRLLVALLGVQAQVNAPLPPRVTGPSAERGGLGAHHRVDVRAPGRRILALNPGVAGLPNHRHHGVAAVSLDSHSPGCSGKIQVPCGVCSAQVPGAPEQGVLVLPTQYGGDSTGGARPYTRPSRPRGGAPSRVAPHRGDTLCPAPCLAGRTGGP